MLRNTNSGHLGTEVKQYLEKLQRWFADLHETKLIRPTIVTDEEDKAVVLYCTDDLWDVVQRWKDINLKTMTFFDFVKLWKEIKKIMEKGEKG